MDGKAKCAGRRGLRIAVCVACGLLLAWLAFVLAYNVWRSPENIFEEVYWGCIDADSCRAALFEKGVFWPGEYLPAFFNPNKNDSMEKIGASRNIPDYTSITHRTWKDKLGVSPQSAWAELFGHWKYTLKDGWSALSGTGAKAVGDVWIETMGDETCLSKEDDVLVVTICLSYSEAHDTDFENGSYIALVRFKFPLDGGPVSIRVIHGDKADVDDAIQVAKALLAQFLSEYLSAYPESEFQRSNLNDWNWGSVTEERTEYLYWQ